MQKRKTDYMIPDCRFERITLGSVRELEGDPRVFWGGTAVILLSSWQREALRRAIRDSDPQK